MLPVLYGYDSKGKVKIWYVTTEGAVVHVHHGQEGGKITIRSTTSKAKNVGRANETTPEEQAIKDATSKWNKQKDKNYHENLSAAVPLENPMLAHDYRKQGHRITFPCYVQPKLDGVRCLVKYDYETKKITFKSRGNKEYPIIPEIEKQLRVIFEKHFCHKIMLDGELYIHGESLQNIISAVKKHEDDEGNIKESTNKLKFHIFDIVPLDFQKDTNSQRIQDLEGLESVYTPDRIEYVKSEYCTTEPSLAKYHGKYKAMGYEGVMLRNIGGVYKLNTRSADLQKYKEFMDDEYVCTGVKIDKDGFGVLQFDGFDASWKGTHEERKAIAKNPTKWIGEKITIQYQSLTDDGLPQFPVAVALRNYEE